MREQYHPHVDGLRALAVIAVVLFHLDTPYLTAGFMGVDVFFVISGFLITGHVIKEREVNQFSFLKFYGRRIRRLLPALFVVLCAALVVSCFILTPIYLEELAEQTLAAMLAISNVFFWINSGYFDSDSSLKPLLHTWSLGVEEQFYLVWPLLILLLWKIKHWAIPAIALISLLACEWMLRWDSSAAFFLMPFRVIEFCIGALAFSLMHKQVSSLIKQWLAVLGLASILAAFFFYSKDIVFPGVNALAACLGTAFVIYSGQSTLVGRLLSVRPALWIGAISYSLYLCHWPVIVLTRHLYGSNESVVDVALDLGLFSIAAVVLFYLVEKPFRKKALDGNFRISRKVLILFLLMCVTVIASLSAFIIHSQGRLLSQTTLLTKADHEKGMAARLVPLQTACGLRTWEKCYDPTPDGFNVMVIGDSHALDGFNIVSIAYPHAHVYLKALPGGCAPMVSEDEVLMGPNHPGRQECVDFNRSLFTRDSLKEADAIVISAMIRRYRGEHVLRTVKALREKVADDVKIIVLGGYFVLHKNMLDLANQQIDPRIHKEYVDDLARDEDLLRDNANTLNYIYVSKKALVCSDEELTSCPIYFGEEPFAFDGNHLTLSAAKAMGERLAKTHPTLFD